MEDDDGAPIDRPPVFSAAAMAEAGALDDPPPPATPPSTCAPDTDDNDISSAHSAAATEAAAAGDDDMNAAILAPAPAPVVVADAGLAEEEEEPAVVAEQEREQEPEEGEVAAAAAAAVLLQERDEEEEEGLEAEAEAEAEGGGSGSFVEATTAEFVPADADVTGADVVAVAAPPAPETSEMSSVQEAAIQVDEAPALATSSDGEGVDGLLGRIGAAVGGDLQKLDKAQFDVLVESLRGLTTDVAPAAEAGQEAAMATPQRLVEQQQQQQDEPEAEVPPAPAAHAADQQLPPPRLPGLAAATALEPPPLASALDFARGEATAWGPSSARGGSTSARAARAAAQRYRDKGEGLTVQERLAQIEFSDDEDEECEDGLGTDDPTAAARRRDHQPRCNSVDAVTVEACEPFASPHAAGLGAPCQVEELQAF